MGSALLLVHEDSQRFVPIFVGPGEALAFRRRLDGEPFKRPLPYDLIDALLELAGASLSHVRIDELRGDVFIAAVVLVRDGEEIALDARASDATILAMGAGAPIYASHRLMDGVARPLEGTPLERDLSEEAG